MASGYYGVKCKTENCQGVIRLGDLQNSEPGLLIIYTPPVEAVECSFCHGKHTYGSSDIIEFETDEEPGFGLPK